MCNRNEHAQRRRGQATYPGADAAAAGGDLEVPVEILDGARGEETLHHQQDAVHEEGRRDAIDHVLEDVDPGGDRDCVSTSAWLTCSQAPHPLLWDEGYRVFMFTREAGWRSVLAP